TPPQSASATLQIPPWQQQSRVTLQSTLCDWAFVGQAEQEPSASDLDVGFTLAELSWAPMLSDRLYMTVGKFNLSYEQPGPFQVLDFTSQSSDPFDDYSDIEGMKMISLDYLSGENADGWTISPSIAEGQGQRGAADTPSYQWQLALQRSFDSLSLTLLAQQPEGWEPGVGASWSWVAGSAWQLMGSAFVRKGTQYTDAMESAFEPVPEITGIESPLIRSQSKYYPRLQFGLEWSDLNQSLAWNWRYDSRLLTRDEQGQLYLATNADASSTAGWQDEIPAESADWVADIQSVLVSELTRIRSGRHQQHYMYASYRRSLELWAGKQTEFGTSLLMGMDESHIWQLELDHSVSWSFTLQVDLLRFNGAEDSEFGSLPWLWQGRVGFQWVL
ncbi:MAG: hypothetical protein ACPGYX_06885, partial [Oceanobacter sp.]